MSHVGVNNSASLPPDFTFEQLMEWAIENARNKCETTILQDPHPNDGKHFCFMSLYLIFTPIVNERRIIKGILDYSRQSTLIFVIITTQTDLFVGHIRKNCFKQ